jgi:hypothetical protein
VTCAGLLRVMLSERSRRLGSKDAKTERSSVGLLLSQAAAGALAVHGF